ncbi:MAG TPA: (deoxy)nucleoside triphosphate pyrophosphohydrolase [Candidatus Didemnitutus sp.]|nr:(deoxy)nucleoside triphosphate pyrophosphohydrolase [Candidatus Didemnitutus sp.]
MSAKPPVPVVCAVIVRDGQVLLARRPPGKLMALKWEFAGGKVEPNENPAVAIAREIREELGCVIELARVLPPFLHDYQTVVIRMIPFVCKLAYGSPEPTAHEHTEIAWIAPAEFEKYDLAAADWPVVKAFRESL